MARLTVTLDSETTAQSQEGAIKRFEHRGFDPWAFPDVMLVDESVRERTPIRNDRRYSGHTDF